MDPHSFIARAEAQRWLGIAEKLLISHDLVGSKTFAIRARESDPRLEAADQILAIADTLLAAEKRVVGTNGAHQPDYYAILQLVRFVQDTDHIASQFRRLAVALNPHHNRFPYADQAFQLVNDAWAVLSNPMRKSMYDSDLDYPSQQQMNTLGFNIEQQQQQQHQQQHHQQHQQQQQQQQQQPHNFFSINHIGGSHEQSHQHQSHQHQHQQLQQHNFLPQVQPFQVNSPPHQQTRPSPQPQGHIQSPPATPQHPFSWPQASQMSQQLQHQQIKQEQQQHHQQLKQEQHMQQHLKQEQQIKQQQLHQEQLKQQQMQQEQLKQQKLQQEQLKQQQLQEEQRKQQQMMEEQRKQQQLMEEQRKQQQLQEEQRRQQQLLEEQRKQQQLLEEQRKQQQLLEEQRKQQQLLEEQRRQQQLLEEQRKQQQLLEEQRKQQQLLEEQRKQQQLLEEQRKQQQLLEEQQKQQQKQQQLLEEQRKQQQLLEEQRKQQQLEEEQRKQQQLEEEQRKQQQLQEQQRKQQQLQEEQRKQQQEQQQQESVKHNAAPVQHPSWVNSNNGVRDEEAEPEPVDDSPTFWTACPFCFYMYEYPKVYVECTLRCDNCKRAYQAVRISSPPPIIEGQDAYFYCWGFFPIALSMSDMQKNNNKVTNTNWTPFSSLHNASNNVQNHLNEQAAPKENLFVNKSSGPRIYFDDITDDVFIGVSEPSSDSDTEWVGTKKQKSKRTDKGFKDRIQVLALRAVYTGNGSVKNLKHGIPVQEGVEVPTVLVVEAGKINVGSNPRKQPGRVAQELGKLDLNVEFNNNEGEETVSRMTAGTRTHEQGEEESVEGTEFFEGLDEYLSSLPILSVVNEEKVKAA